MELKPGSTITDNAAYTVIKYFKNSLVQSDHALRRTLSFEAGALNVLIYGDFVSSSKATYYGV